MTIPDHHLLCLGVMAGIYQKSKSRVDFTDLDTSDQIAIEEAIASAEAMGLPVSLERLKRGEPICTTVNQ